MPYTFDFKTMELIPSSGIVDNNITDPDIEKEEEDNEGLDKFDAEMTYTPSTVLEDEKAMDVIRTYMKDF